MNFIENLKENKDIDEFVVDKTMPPLYNFLHVIDEKLSYLAYLEYLKIKSEKTYDINTSDLETLLWRFEYLFNASGEVLGGTANYRAFNNVTLRNINFKEPISYKQCRFYISEVVKDIFKNIKIFMRAKDKNGLNKLDNNMISSYVVDLSLINENLMAKELLGKVPNLDIELYDEDLISILKKVPHKSIKWVSELIDLAIKEVDSEENKAEKALKIKKAKRLIADYNSNVESGLYFAHRDPSYIYADNDTEYERDREFVWLRKQDIDGANKISANLTKENFIEKYDIPEELHNEMINVKKFRIGGSKK